ncbi:MAG: hypothetical protein AUK35_07225 [Zetaproteobacteria bacterium CG2_30_46_52]|nr:MAG: hypothetical protein AUK35_07225 [Zetaproteobacteria bacterium CG2_30_46_52]
MTPEEQQAARKKRRGTGENFSLWLNPDQKNELHSRVDASGAPSPSAYIKRRVFGTEFTPTCRRPIAKADPALIRHLSWIGNNVNQIARVCNHSRELSPEQAASIYASLALIAEELEALSETAKQ